MVAARRLSLQLLIARSGPFLSLTIMCRTPRYLRAASHGPLRSLSWRNVRPLFGILYVRFAMANCLVFVCSWPGARAAWQSRPGAAGRRRPLPSSCRLIGAHRRRVPVLRQCTRTGLRARATRYVHAPRGEWQQEEAGAAACMRAIRPIGTLRHISFGRRSRLQRERFERTERHTS
jgi:hypothetical protein